MRMLYRLGEAAGVFLVVFFVLHGFVSWPWAAGCGLAPAALQFFWPYLQAWLVALKVKVFG